MKKGDLLRVGEVVRVLSGNHRGLVGTVMEIRKDTVSVYFEGVRDSEPFRHVASFKQGALGRNHD